MDEGKADVQKNRQTLRKIHTSIYIIVEIKYIDSLCRARDDKGKETICWAVQMWIDVKETIMKH